MSSMRPIITPAPRPVRTETIPVILHVVILASPQGTGSIELVDEMKNTHYEDGTVHTSVRGPFQRGSIELTDDLGDWRFAYTTTSLGPHAIGLTLKSTSAEIIELDWNRSVFVDVTGRANRILHAGVRYSDRTSITAPSIVPPGATLDDFVFPSDGITLSGTSWVAPPVIENLRAGQTVSILLALKAGDRAALRTFRFLVKWAANTSAGLGEGLSALKGLRSAVDSGGISALEYARRVADAKMTIDRSIERPPADPASRAVSEAFSTYVFANAVLSRRVTTGRLTSTSTEAGEGPQGCRRWTSYLEAQWQRRTAGGRTEHDVPDVLRVLWSCAADQVAEAEKLVLEQSQSGAP